MSARSILVVGAGGREHALVLALSASPVVSSIIVAPGNGGTAQVRKAVNVAAHGVAELVDLAIYRCVDLVVVGPEAPLADGLADELTRVGIRCFGPSKAAAQLETSKVFAKEFMQRHSIPTARFKAFRDFAAAEAFCRSGVFGNQMVVKASGLAAGKGVILATSPDEATAACKAALVDGEFGDAGREVVVEELLSGPEVSLLAFCDGRSAVPFLPASDHKRIFEFDRGLNTGGMGVIAPARALPAHQVGAVAAATLEPVLRGMAAEGHPFVGILFAGLMMTADGPRVLEYNVRFGDPEAQALIPLLETDLLSVIEACLDGKLAETEVRFKRGAASCALVAAASGYPGAVKKGIHITLPSPTQLPAGTTIFHAGTRIAAMDAAIGGQPDVVTDGGRVLAVSAVAGTLKAALREAYGVLGSVHFEGMQYRRDIGGCWHWPHREAAALGAAPTPIRSAATAGELALGGAGAPLPRGDALRIGVLGSTRGTDLVPILAAITSGRLLGAQVVVVVSNRAEAGILEKAAAAGIPSVHATSKGRSREDFEAEVVAHLAAHDVDVVLLIGFMRVLSPAFCERFAWRMLNVHPSLLPDFAGGMDGDVHAAVLAAGKAVTGCTVHFVEPTVDAGPPLVQRCCAVVPGDTPDTLKARVQALEGEAFIDALSLYTADSPVDLLQELRRSGGTWPAVLASLRAAGLPFEIGPASAAARKATSVAAADGAASGAGGASAHLTYAEAGVDIDAGDALVERIKPMCKATSRRGADVDLGGFGGLFDLKAAGFKDPLLCAGTDGVGTKLKLAQVAATLPHRPTNGHHTLGIDLVAMSVNDIIVQGAEPLLFLDYYATGHLSVAEAADVITGIAEGCKLSGCALLGGETAEMPSLYAHGDYDLAGFAVGAVERDAVLPALHRQAAGDVLLGLASSGVHSNGFSLVRRVAQEAGADLAGPAPYASAHASLVEDLLTPTRIYVKSLLPVLQRAGSSGVVALAHITGGGLPGNLPRVLGDGLGAQLDCTAWEIPPVFRWLQRAARPVRPYEMARTFNLGLGMVLVVKSEAAAAVADALTAAGERVWRVGTIVPCASKEEAERVQLDRLDEAFGAQ